MARYSVGTMRSTLILALFTTCLSAMDWSAYDKQLHAASGALGAYVICDVLERKTDLPPWARWLIATGVMMVAGWGYEYGNSKGYYEAEDAHATTIGAMGGATLHTGVSIIFSNDSISLGASYRF